MDNVTTYHMNFNLWAKIYIICRISLLQLQKWGHTMVYAVEKKEKNCFHVLSWLLFFAGGGLSRQWKKSRLFCNMWSYEVIFVRNFLPSSLNYFFVKRLSGKKCALQKQRWLFKVWLSFWLMTRQLSRDHLTSIRPTSSKQHDFFQVFQPMAAPHGLFTSVSGLCHKEISFCL